MLQIIAYSHQGRDVGMEPSAPLGLSEVGVWGQVLCAPAPTPCSCIPKINLVGGQVSHKYQLVTFSNDKAISLLTYFQPTLLGPCHY